MLTRLRDVFVAILKQIQDALAPSKIVVLGDSHSDVFLHPHFRLHMPFTSFEVCSVHGATVSGLQNPNSTTNALAVFRQRLAELPSGRTVILLIGEVDTGFVIWFRAAKYGVPVEEMLQTAVSNYIELIEEVALRFKPIVLSAPLPTIADGNDWGDVANQRRSIDATLRERTELTLSFNKKIQVYCKGRFSYVNLDKLALAPNGYVSAHLLNNDPTDHHYDSAAYAKDILPQLREAMRKV